VRTETQVSAGGVPYRRREGRVEVAIVSVGPQGRWQLPKGIVDPGEAPDATAVREVREETGLDTELVAPIDTVEYWYQGTSRGERIRYHKYVHFFLLAYRSGDVSDHDQEVNEARWVALDDAERMLAFKNERQAVGRARRLIEELR
jgi:8-oxo-dGTP pyrophosphatase MutT (NUDIX family)